MKKKTVAVAVIALLISACSWNGGAARKAGIWLERATTSIPRALSDPVPSPGTDKHVVCGPATVTASELDFPVVLADRMPRDWKKNREAAKDACKEHGFPAVASSEETAEAKRNLRQMNRTGVFETVRLKFTDEDFLVLSKFGMIEPVLSERRRIKIAR